MTINNKFIQINMTQSIKNPIAHKQQGSHNVLSLYFCTFLCYPQCYKWFRCCKGRIDTTSDHVNFPLLTTHFRQHVDKRVHLKDQYRTVIVQFTF